MRKQHPKLLIQVRKVNGKWFPREGGGTNHSSSFSLSLSCPLSAFLIDEKERDGEIDREKGWRKEKRHDGD